MQTPTALWQFPVSRPIIFQCWSEKCATEDSNHGKWIGLYQSLYLSWSFGPLVRSRLKDGSTSLILSHLLYIFSHMFRHCPFSPICLGTVHLLYMSRYFISFSVSQGTARFLNTILEISLNFVNRFFFNLRYYRNSPAHHMREAVKIPIPRN